MDPVGLLIGSSFMLGLGSALGAGLALAAGRLRVEENPRIDEVEALLPGNNCGACAEPGCRAFAEKAAAGKAAPARCTVSTPEGIERIAELLGVEAGSREKVVARLACAGGAHTARQRAVYRGLKTCSAAELVAGGGKGCAWGCLGHGDCDEACDFDAIEMSPLGLPIVDEDRCTACGDCVDACPRDLFSLQPQGRRLWVACKSLAAGDAAERECAVACTGCGLCAADAPAGLIAMKENLAVIDYSRAHEAARACIERCPTGAIIWWTGDARCERGAAAAAVVRREPLPVG